MKVKLVISRCGAGFTDNVGDEIEVTKEEAKRMMEASPPQCVPVRGKNKVEKATKK
jgi:hypothetical protein